MTLQDQIEQGLLSVKTDLQDKIQTTETILQDQIQSLSDRISALETKNTGDNIYTKLAFLQRFTTEELIAIETEMINDPILRVLQNQQKVAEYIDVTDANTIAGVNYLVTKTLLTQARADEILSIEPIVTP